ncbi:MAG TPA: 6-phosphogluconolactonase [Solirubrobacterales bacterium]|nr:6-phosphogluconolactonase [Solirubrobacterales bacterium]
MTAVHVAASAEEAAHWAADRIAEGVDEARGARGAAHLALAGGTTPRRAYELLASGIDDWAGVEIWFGDERAVGPQDPDSNYRMVAETLLATGREGIPRAHRMEGERGADGAARAYAAELLERLPLDEQGVPVLDLALLGLGPDGHTASLFPGSPALAADGVCAAVHGAPKPPPDRITLTVPVLRAARRVVFLATGADKAEAVEGLLRGPDPSLPASLLAGPRTELIVDSAAGRGIASR